MIGMTMKRMLRATSVLLILAIAQTGTLTKGAP
jgi:hypothetical protein